MMTEEEKLALGIVDDPSVQPPIDTPIETPSIDQAATEQTALPIPQSLEDRLRERLSQDYMAEGLLKAGKAFAEQATGKKLGDIDITSDLRSRLAKAEQAKIPVKAKALQKEDFFVDEGPYKGAMIAFDPNTGMRRFMDPKTGQWKTQDDPDPEVRKAFSKVRKRMVEKGAWQKDYDQKQLALKQKGFDLAVARHKLALKKDVRPNPSVQQALAGVDQLQADMDNALKVFSSESIPSGVIPGLRNKAAQWFNIDDPEVSKAYSQLGMNLANFIKDRSGAAVSDKERKFLESITPSQYDKKETLMAKIAMVKEYMRRKRASIENVQKQLGKDVPLADRHTKMLTVETDDLQSTYNDMVKDRTKKAKEAKKAEKEILGQDPKVLKYAEDYLQGDYNKARQILVNRGYTPQEK